MLERRFVRFCGEFTSDMGLGKDHVLALMTQRVVSVRGPRGVRGVSLFKTMRFLSHHRFWLHGLQSRKLFWLLNIYTSSCVYRYLYT